MTVYEPTLCCYMHLIKQPKSSYHAKGAKFGRICGPTIGNAKGLQGTSFVLSQACLANLTIMLVLFFFAATVFFGGGRGAYLNI